MTSLVRNFEDIHYQYENGFLDEVGFRAFVHASVDMPVSEAIQPLPLSSPWVARKP